MPPASPISSDHDDLARQLAARVAALAEISSGSEPGVTRLALTSTEREAHRLVAGWAAAAGATTACDLVGNTVMTYRQGPRYLLLGSHLDTVANGGRFDGVVGVLAALEVAERVACCCGIGVRAVAFAAEESVRFGYPSLGASVAVGKLDAESLERIWDVDRVSAASAARMPQLEARLSPGWASRSEVAAFLELHIEQGPVLEKLGLGLGVVDSIAGIVRLQVVVTGRAGHSGASPMRGRADALVAAAELVVEAQRIGSSHPRSTVTVGQFNVEPNSPTVIPARVGLVIDVRSAERETQRHVVRDLRSAVRGIDARQGITSHAQVLSSRDPVQLSSVVVNEFVRAADGLGIPHAVLRSGGGHDAAILAEYVPTGMVFVASPGARSHVADEACSLEDVAVACSVMAEGAISLSRVLSP